MDTQIKIVLCHDEAVSLIRQQNLISMILRDMKIYNFSIKLFCCANTLLEAKEGFDLIFLDTTLSETHAFKLADSLVNQHNYLKIIYVSSELTLSQDSLRHHAFRFLSKPLQYDDLKEALATFLRFQSEHQISLCFEQKQIRRVWLNEIIYVEAIEKQSEFYFVDNSCFVDNKRLKYWRDYLANYPLFYSESRLHIINLKEIVCLNNETKEVEFKDFSISLSRREFTKLKKILLDQ